MLKLNEIASWLEDIWRIIFDINVSIENIKRIAIPQSEIEKQVLQHGFFNQFYRQSRFTIVVQLCKLFDDNDNQKRNFYKLFNRLSSEKYDKDLETKLENNRGLQNLFTSRTDILNELDILKGEFESNAILLNKVKLYRNKIYAHSDPSNDLPQLSNAELDVLVELAKEIYNVINSKLFNKTLLFEHNDDWKIDKLLKILVENRKEYLVKLNQDIRSKA